MNFKPIKDNILVKQHVQKESKGGIIFADAHIPKPLSGEVVSISDGYYDSQGKFASLQVNIGDLISYGKNVPDTITIDGDEYMKVNQNDILLINEQKCLDDVVMIEVDPPLTKTCGVILPFPISSNRGSVIFKGKKSDLKAGDRVVYDVHRYVEVRLNNKNYAMMREKDLLGVIE